MNSEYTAVIKQDGKWWLGWIEEVPGVNCQESSYDELLESLRVTLLEALLGKSAKTTTSPPFPNDNNSHSSKDQCP